LNTVRFPFISAPRLVELRGAELLSKDQYIFCLESRAVRDADPTATPTPSPPKLEESETVKAAIVLNTSPRKLQRRTEIDLVIVCDNTSSMSPEIASMITTVESIVSEIAERARGMEGKKNKKHTNEQSQHFFLLACCRFRPICTCDLPRPH